MNPILLTDKEMMAVISRCEGTVKEARHEVNKAQLKKVYGARLAEFIDDRGRECISIDKEALLKEIDEDKTEKKR